MTTTVININSKKKKKKKVININGKKNKTEYEQQSGFEPVSVAGYYSSTRPLVLIFFISNCKISIVKLFPFGQSNAVLGNQKREKVRS